MINIKGDRLLFESIPCISTSGGVALQAELASEFAGFGQAVYTEPHRGFSSAPSGITENCSLVCSL